MTVGGATAPLSGTFRIRLKTAFDGTKYKLTFYSDMDEWLKCHIAFILPVCYVCYACNGDLTRPPNSSALPFWMPPMKPA